VVRFEEVRKSYPAASGEVRTLRDLVSRRLPTLLGSGRTEVLRGVSFDVRRGESVGLVGHNGAGKSTILRLAAGLSRPTSGRLQVQGEVRAVLSLGEAFEPTLNGRENAVTTAMVAGLTEREARALLPQILDFAELEEHADAPVRTYSEGMKLRLAMGVAAHLAADVVLLDEVLAVGDLSFQQKCLDQIASRVATGATMVFASHDLDRVASVCDSAVWLEHGRVRAAGEAHAVVSAYRRAVLDETVAKTPDSQGVGEGKLVLGRDRFGSQEVRIAEAHVTGPRSAAEGEIAVGDAVVVDLRIAADAPWPRECVVTVSIHRDSDGLKCLDANTKADGIRVSVGEGGADVRLTYEEVPLVPGQYHVEIGVYRPDWEYAYDMHVAAYPLRVIGPVEGGQGVVSAARSWKVR